MQKNKKRTLHLMILALLLIVVSGSFLSIRAQALPEAAILPDGKSAWAVDQLFKTNIGGSYLGGYIRVVILSDGKIFHRKTFDNGQPATPWCQDQFTAEEMRDIRSAMAAAKPSAWQQRYGEWINLYAPFRKLTITVREASGQAIDYTTMVYRESEMPDEIARIAKATDAAGNLAFSNCQTSASNPNPSVTDKLENGATIYAINQAGNLLWYRHSGFQNGEAVWAHNGSAKNVGYEWNGNVKVFKGDPRGKDGVIYTVSQEGSLTWYKHEGFASGASDWVNGKNVNINFNGLHVLAAGSGILYQVDNAGNLYWTLITPATSTGTNISVTPTVKKYGRIMAKLFR